MLTKAVPSDALEIWEMQKRAFRVLYEKYNDLGSPYLEPLTKIEARLRHPDGAYYRIELDGQTVGAVYLLHRELGRFRIGPLFVLPEFQNHGVAQAAILTLETRYRLGVWELDTPLQEPGNCHLYEKIGYVRTGTQMIVNDRLTLIGYQKIVK